MLAAWLECSLHTRLPLYSHVEDACVEGGGARGLASRVRERLRWERAPGGATERVRAVAKGQGHAACGRGKGGRIARSVNGAQGGRRCGRRRRTRLARARAGACGGGEGARRDGRGRAVILRRAWTGTRRVREGLGGGTVRAAQDEAVQGQHATESGRTGGVKHASVGRQGGASRPHAVGAALETKAVPSATKSKRFVQEGGRGEARDSARAQT